MKRAMCLIAAGIWGSFAALAQQGGIPTFGTTVVVPGGLIGVVYYIPPASMFLPDFQKLDPAGVIYTGSLNVPPRKFSEGFPGVTDRFEWFAIDYTGRFWIEKPAVYQFALTSDDGAKLYIDDGLVVNNDGIHSAEVKTALFGLSRGIHRIRVSYFQGPREVVALMLQIAGPGEQLRIFSTEEFKPPPNLDISDAESGSAARVPGRELRISSAEGSPGDEIAVEVAFEPPPQKALVALEWRLVVPAQVLELAAEGPEIGRAATDSGKLVRCSMQKSYLYVCLLAGGQKPIARGPIAVFHFKIRSDAQPKTTAVRAEKVQGVVLDGRESDLSDAEGAVTIR